MNLTDLLFHPQILLETLLPLLFILSIVTIYYHKKKLRRQTEEDRDWQIIERLYYNKIINIKNHNNNRYYPQEISIEKVVYQAKTFSECCLQIKNYKDDENKSYYIKMKELHKD